MDNKIRKIIIVGGGTAGWLSALFLDRMINSPAEKFCEITLIESKTIGIIGVGEATVNGIIGFLHLLNIDEYDFLVNCDGSFKLGIKFVNWLHGKNEVYWHPFSISAPQIGDYSIYDVWLNKKLRGEKIDDYGYYYLNPFLCDLNKGPKHFNENRNYQGETTYAYHINTDLLGKYLAKIGRQRGIKHLTDEAGVTDVSFDEKGFISSIITSENGELFADFFLDCSGFKGVLINKAYQEPFNYYTDSLLNESAVAVRLPEEKYPNGMPPYTRATAMKNGWIWDIPLFSRRGIGYVYSSNFISREEAERELMEDYLGMKVGDLKPNHIKMRVGKTRNIWVKNCLSIGLSGGFIEPLESSGIALITTGLRQFSYFFPDKSYNPKLIEYYNDYMTKFYESTRDFLIMHYCTTEREDTEYWKNARHGLKIPDSLKDDLNLYKENRFSFQQFNKHLVRSFHTDSYEFILAGMNNYPAKVLPLLEYKGRDLKIFEEKLENGQQDYIKGSPLLRTLPGHYEYLAHLNHRHSQMNM